MGINMAQIDYNSHPYYVRMELDRMVKRGEIKRYLRETDQELGVVFFVETDQGWDPEPIWQQWPIEDFYLHDAQ